MDIVRYLTLSQDLVQAQLPNGAINGIRVDNPSGSWLRLEPVQVWIPPYVTGWQYPLQNALSISVKWMPAGPSGNVSNAVMPTGQRVAVTLTGDTLAQSDGITAGAGAQVTTIPNWQISSNKALEATEAGANLVVLAATANVIWVIGGMTIGPDPTASSTGAVRDWISVIISGQTSGIVFGRGAISEAAPHCSVPILPANAESQVNENVLVSAFTRAGSGNGMIVMDIVYSQKRALAT